MTASDLLPTQYAVTLAILLPRWVSTALAVEIETSKWPANGKSSRFGSSFER